MKKKICIVLFNLILLLPTMLLMSGCKDAEIHNYFALQFNKDRNEIVFSCDSCNIEQKRCFDDIYNSDGNGTVEYVDIVEGQVVVKPVPNLGYYFLKWEQKSENKSQEYVYESMLYESPQNIIDENLSYKAIFTNDESLILPVTLDVSVENDLSVDIEYLPYVNRDTQCFSYYVHKNDDLVLTSSSSLIVSVNSEPGFGGNSLHHSEDGWIDRLPYCTAYWYMGFIGENKGTENIDTIYLKFADIRNKAIVTLTDNMYKKFIIADKNDKVIINTELFVRSGVFESWKDENGNILSYDEEFSYMANADATLYLTSTRCDVWGTYNGYNYEFKNNPDGTLTLYYISEVANLDQSSVLEIPSVIQNKTVSGIGLLRLDFSYGGKIIIPDTVKDFKANAFKYLTNVICFSSERLDLEASDFYGCSEDVLFDFSETMLRSLVANEIHKLTKDYVGLNVVFSDDMEEGVLGFYTLGTQNITIEKLPENNFYNRNILTVIVHELRHFYQSICIGDVENIQKSDLKILPSDNQYGAWKYLDYTQPSEDYNKYYYNAREVDAREYAEYIVGYDIITTNEN